MGKYLFFLLFINSLFSQEVDEFIYDRVSKNIIAYSIKESGLIDRKVSEQKMFVHKYSSDVFDYLIPSTGYKISFTISETKITYPLEGYVVYAISREYNDFHKGEMAQRTIIRVFELNNNYLIAYNSLTKDLKFLSGNFYLSRICGDFNLKNIEIEKHYIYLRGYKYRLEKEIELLKKSRRRAIYKAFSNELNRFIYVKIYYKKENKIDFKYGPR